MVGVMQYGFGGGSGVSWVIPFSEIGERKNRMLSSIDNMTPGELRAAVRLVAGRARLEASGGVTFETLKEIADTGVDWVSVGALTHSAPALDLSLLLEPLP